MILNRIMYLYLHFYFKTNLSGEDQFKRNNVPHSSCAPQFLLKISNFGTITFFNNNYYEQRE